MVDTMGKSSEDIVRSIVKNKNSKWDSIHILRNYLLLKWKE